MTDTVRVAITTEIDVELDPGDVFESDDMAGDVRAYVSRYGEVASFVLTVDGQEPPQAEEEPKQDAPGPARRRTSTRQRRG